LLQRSVQERASGKAHISERCTAPGSRSFASATNRLGYSGIKSLCRIRGEVAPVERPQCPLQFHSASQVSASCPSLAQALVRASLPCDLLPLGICYIINLLPPLTNTSSILCGSTISNFSAFYATVIGGSK
jgi:hypothetical protein